jgi:hypothetical protein
MTSLDRLVRFGVARRRCAHEHLVCALTSEETHEPFEGRKPIAVSGDAGATGLLGQMGSPARDRRPIIV